MVDQPAILPVGSPGPALEPCAHHWRIESPAGETSQGVCKFCGATRQFANYSRPQEMSRTRRTPFMRRGTASPSAAPLKLPSR